MVDEYDTVDGLKPAPTLGGTAGSGETEARQREAKSAGEVGRGVAGRGGAATGFGEGAREDVEAGDGLDDGAEEPAGVRPAIHGAGAGVAGGASGELKEEATMWRQAFEPKALMYSCWAS